MRLLICISQAAIGAPEDPEDWKDFGLDLPGKATSYLASWPSAFNLLGDGPRFLQRRPAKQGEPTMVSKLVPNLASGNNPTNFDHGGGTERAMEPAPLALALLTFQNRRKTDAACRSFTATTLLDEQTGKILPGLLSWLVRKGEAHGFTFDPNQVRTIPRSRQYFIKSGSLGLHHGVEFQGTLRVVDPDKFRHAFAHGIGSAKAFGFGMLVLAPQ
jgi:hypothetical protein